jgi:hypothetical protein
MALAQMKAAQGSQNKKVAAAKPIPKQAASEKTGDTRSVTLKNKAPEFFTATDGATTKKKKTTAKSATP